MKTTCEIEVTLRAPFITQSSMPGDPGFDSVIARNHENTIMIPNSLFSGKLRQAMEELNSVDRPEDHWFSPATDQWLGTVEQSKQWVFTDFLLIDEEGILQSRYRAKMDQARGVVDEHHLLMIEQYFVNGEDYKFKGELAFFCRDKVSSDEAIKHLKVALKWLNQLGAFRTVGFGQLMLAKVKKVTSKILPELKHPINLKSQSLQYALVPEQAFCLAGKPTAYNLFRSEVIISGGALKASIAKSLAHLLGRHDGIISADDSGAYKALCTHFSSLIFSHAFPTSSSSKRPVVAPLSLTQAGDKQGYFDVAQLSQASLLFGHPPDFSLDWKDTSDTLSMYSWPYLRLKQWGWPSVRSELRVRTAIHRKLRRSEESRLFAYQQVLPSPGLAWLGGVNFSQVPKSEQCKVSAQLQQLLQHGFMGLGKTKTWAKIDFKTSTNHSTVVSSTESSNDEWVICLQTDALLGNPDYLRPCTSENDVFKMYAEAWQDLSSGLLILERCFARQRLTGGSFRKRGNKAESYQPWMLTEAASVFVVKASEKAKLDQVDTLLTTWLSCGLPVADRLIDVYGIDREVPKWQQCPYLSENGFGEISINLKMPDGFKPLTDKDHIVGITELASSGGNT